jgi:hypothetical protein
MTSEFAMEREPAEMSHFAATTRAGVRLLYPPLYIADFMQFMGAQGTGVHIVTTAKTAIELGAPSGLSSHLHQPPCTFDYNGT